jgi:hypothetical protein
MKKEKKAISAKRKARISNKQKIHLSNKVEDRKLEKNRKKEIKKSKPTKTKSAKDFQSSTLSLSKLKESLERSINKPQSSTKKSAKDSNKKKPDKEHPVDLKLKPSLKTNLDKNSLVFSDYSSSPWLFHDEGMAQFFFEDDIQIFSNEEITEEHIFDLSEKLFKSDIGQDVFTYLAANNNIWNKLNLTKEQFANRFSRCSVGEFDKRYRRAQDQVIHLGGPNFIGTFSYTFMDTLHKAYLDRNNNEEVKKKIIELAFEKLKSGKERDIKANWVKEIANNLFGTVETKSKDEKQDSSDFEESTENEQKPVHDYDESFTSTTQEETDEASNSDNSKEDNNPPNDDTKGEDHSPPHVDDSEQEVVSNLPNSENKTKDSNVIRGILKKKIESLSQGRRKDKKQAAQIVHFLQRYLRKFEKLSGKKTKH